METQDLTTVLKQNRWPMSLDHVEKLQGIVRTLNRAYLDTESEERIFLAIDYVFRAGKFLESGTDQDRNIWIGKHRRPDERGLVQVFKEKHLPEYNKIHLVHWVEWLLFTYAPTFYDGNLELWVSYLVRVANGLHPLDALQ